jgi:peptide/nickel transport system substrate-binding protein
MKKSVALGAAGVIAAVATIGWEAPASAQDNNTLRVGVYSKAPTRGNSYGGGGVPNIYWWDPLFDGLTRVNGEGKIVPWLAASWSLVDNSTWRFALRPNVEFTNGAKLDADAVVGHFQWALSDEGRATSGGRELRQIASVTKVDAMTVEIKTTGPFPILPGTLQRAYIMEPKALNDLKLTGYTANPVTTGSYRPARWTDTEAEYVLFEKSWRPGKIRTIRYVELVEATARLQAILSKQIDLAITVSPDDLEQVRRAGQSAHIFASPNIMNLAFFTKDFAKAYGDKGTPFADKRVRYAANIAFDRNAIIQGLMGGTTQPANQPSNPRAFGFNKDVQNYPYDPARARRMLAAAGYPNGFKATIEFIPGAIPRDNEIYSYITEQLTRAGMQIELRQTLFPTWLPKYLNGAWDSQASGFSAFVDPHMDSSRPFQNFTCITPNAMICIDEIMPMVNAQFAEMDTGKREKMLQDIMKKWHDDAITTPILYGVDIFAATPRLKNFEYWNRVLLWEKMTLEGS